MHLQRGHAGRIPSYMIHGKLGLAILPQFTNGLSGFAFVEPEAVHDHFGHRILLVRVRNHFRQLGQSSSWRGLLRQAHNVLRSEGMELLADLAIPCDIDHTHAVLLAPLSSQLNFLAKLSAHNIVAIIVEQGGRGCALPCIAGLLGACPKNPAPKCAGQNIDVLIDDSIRQTHSGIAGTFPGKWVFVRIIRVFLPIMGLA